VLTGLKKIIQKVTHPVSSQLGVGTRVDLTRSRRELLLKNALLWQQLTILERLVQRPKMTWRDRIKLLLLARFLQKWKSLLKIVQPETCCAGTATCSS
jgi:hypothetical protein